MPHTSRPLFITAVALLLLVSLSTNGQQAREPKNVAIFLYENVELLDFAGPGETFSAAGFKTYTVSVDGKSLTSQGFVVIQPEFSIDNAPAPDIIVFPGGNSGPSSNDPRVIDWIRKLNAGGTDFMSVCTGAFILAKAGLLENKRITTHWGSTKSLGRQYPSSTVMENTRWVDNGFVITTAGVSAGIDGALHFVSRIKGADEAKKIARYMEYDKWDPQNGEVDYHNDYFTAILTASGNPEKNIAQPSMSRTPYCGEFINLSNDLISKKEFDKASKVLLAGLKIYPESDALYKILGDMNRSTGKPAPMDEATIVKMIRDGNVDQAITQIEKDKKAFPKWKLFTEDAVKDAAYYLLQEKKNYDGAIKAFEINTKEFPQSADAFDSLGEAYLAAGKKSEGIASYKKAAAMGYPNSIKVLKDLGVN